MESVETRLRNEKYELQEKLSAAQAFRLSTGYQNLNIAERCLLDTQIGIMQSYVEVLTNRIILLKTKEWDEISEKENERDIKFNKIITGFIDKMDAFFEEEGDE